MGMAIRRLEDEEWATFRRPSGASGRFVAWNGDDLDALHVLPDVAGAGIGSAPMAAAAGTARLWVIEADHSGRAFYQRRGRRPSGRTQRTYGDVVELEYTGSVRILRPVSQAASRTSRNPRSS